ncbi:MULTISPECIES: transferrin-binding protein-like solute binding protein [Neisseria]|jgi:lactoferrin-binding protein B|uniref:Transferrin-binding protein B n=5 Tax=Neisseria TaxID=482 RepID=A0ABD7EXI7_NEIPE|nr:MULTISPECIES: transferrin-binding protein-like solute binding protein [Neisseria]MBF1294258.1 transferrin-binding protein-like solute binding protein [Neisseria sp.]MCL9787144.1 transferrin-binding protein-like solute binding protein [Neisseria subflava]OFM96272.1 lactoferrin-binding protein B [Neisseria sp. HMSC072C05]OFO39599.1 lactoferrin-binding protein B [Neisseria sp. HMSC075C10]OFR71184.1 lactoferrin-binding protein B [Neisseria sp. HMSC069H12]
MCKPNYGGIVLLPLLLASCIGGNFGVQPVVESTPTAQTPSDSKPSKPEDIPAPAPAKPSIETTPVNQPAVGAAMRLPRRNIAFYNKDGTEIPDKHQAEEYLPLKEEDILFLDGTPQEQVDKLKKEIKGRHPNAQIYTSDSKDAVYQYKYVRAGYVYTQTGEDEIKQNSGGKRFTHRFGYDGFVYYSGEHPSQSLPSAGTVKYSGNWQYMTDAKRHRTGQAVASENLGYNTYYGNNIGATSYAARDADDREKHPAEYTVNFDKKNLEGKLIKNQYVQNKNNPDEPKKPLIIYNITAKLDGNRFIGSAKVNPDLAEKHAGKEHLFFHADADQRLEGGFFGDNGEELAGRFISNDKSVFGVFAGKQNSSVPSETHTKILDSLKIAADEAADPKARPFIAEPMPDFAHPDKLLVEGREISLVKDTQTIVLADGRKTTIRTCCDFLNYVKIGRMQTDRPVVKPTATEDEDSDHEGAGPDDENESLEPEDGEDGLENDTDDGHASSELPAEEDNGEANTAGKNEGNNAESVGTDGKSPVQPASAYRNIDLFIKGIRTSEADIPKIGNVHYRGSWEARIGAPIQWDNHADKAAKAEFDVNFANKSLSGTLMEKNGVEPAFYIENGIIEHNGFHAAARTRDTGIDLLGRGATSSKPFKAENLHVTGGFYGPHASELGGSFAEPQQKIGVVFGAKKDDKEATR